jgi:hypothetical protein
MRVRFFLIAALLAFASGCGGGSSNANPAPGPLSGNWQMSMQKQDSTLSPKTQSGFLLQTNNAVSGSLILQATGCSGVGNVAGSVSGPNVALTVALTGINVNLTGTIGQGSQNMSGNYTIISSGCSGPQTAPEIGTWTANLVQSVNGNFQAIYDSKKAGILPVTGKVSQAQANGTSASLTGNLSMSGYCFSTANIVGTISGTTVVMNLVGSDGTQVGTISGAAALDGKSVSGQLFVVPQGPGGQAPCVDGDSGTITLTL